MTGKTVKAIAGALGLQPEASETACLDAIGALKTGAVSKAVHDATLATLDAAKSELETIRSAGRKAEVDALIEKSRKAARPAR